MEDTTLISSAETELKHFGTFLDDYDKKLKKLLVRASNALVDVKAKTDKPVELDFSANREELPLTRLLESDRLLYKTILTFSHLCTEVDSIVEDAREMQTKFLYLDEDLLCTGPQENKESANENSQSNENVLLKMSLSMEFLCHVQFLLQRCIVLGNNILHQCGAFYACEDAANADFKMFDVFDCLADLLHQLLIFDEILATSNFCRFWASYKKTLEAVAHNTESQKICTNSELNGLRNCLQELEFLFMGTIFRSFLDSTFTLKEKIGPKGIGQLSQQFNDYVKHNLSLIDKFDSTDLSELNESQALVRLNGFCVMFHDFCGQIDSKHVKHLLELNAKYQGIMLFGNVTWVATFFLRKHAETLVKSHEKLLPDPLRQRQIFLSNRVQSLQRDCRSYCRLALLWTLNVQKALSTGAFDLKVEQFKKLATLLLLGLRYAGQISFIVKAVISAHVFLRVPMTKPTLLSVCKLIETLKTIQLTYHKNTESISKVIQCIVQYLQYKMLYLLSVCKKKITAAKMHDRNVDALAAIKIAEKCMNGPATRTRMLVTKLAISAANAQNRMLSPDHNEKFRTIAQRIELLSTFQKNLKQICDTAFIYWHQSIITAYLKQVVDRKMDFHSFEYLIQCVNSCVRSLDRLELGNLTLAEMLKRANFDCTRNEIISKLCAQIEIFLRLEVHSNLQLEKMSPFEQGINDYRALIDLCPIELNGNYIVLKDHVENYLSAMFYNLTTISLHDWKTYEEMRHLANNRLMLKPVEDYLPNQTLEQGIDILEIMRKIHIFVSKYVYNMNSQIFVEQQSANKHLDSIGIRHVANSLRTHGTGVINTTVNFTYQFLRQKFYTFSQFLYDEQIKSRLMKELRSFAEKKQGNSYPLYSYERADAFNKDIRKLGLANGGETYMDLFRKVITHVGNAMGYIRLVRSGSIHANYSASLYLPKFDEHLTFAESCKQHTLHETTITAAQNLEANIENLAKSFSDSTDYFKLLVEAFQPFFRNPHNLHLKNFFLIMPPLTLNYIEYMLRVKERINKRDRQEAVLFDDGFAVGLAYILKLLNQISDFNSLQWFNTVRDRFEAERQKIKQMLSDLNASNMAAKGSANAATQKTEKEKLQQTLILTERRINAHQMEYNLLYYNLCSAKIFFQ